MSPRVNYMVELPLEIEEMLTHRRLERVAVNIDHALSVIRMAEQHVQTAHLLSETADHAMAFTAAYDGVRKALSAVLASEGLRTRPVGGAHRNTGVAASAFVAHDALSEFEWMRQVRNSTEYPDNKRPTATKQDVIEAIEAASVIVKVCSAYVSR